MREAGAGATGEDLDEAGDDDHETKPGGADHVGMILDADRCPRCVLRRQWCLCAEVPRVETRTKIVIVRHYREVTRSSNSGRLAGLALPNCQIVDHGAPGTPATTLDGRGVSPVGRAAEGQRGWIDGEGAALLFPGGVPLTAERAPAQLVILDGTWSQVRRMRRKVGGLERMPTVTIPMVPTDAPRMRASPGEGKVSTLEAIAHALGVLEGAQVRDALLALFELAVARHRATGRNSPALLGH